MSWETIPLSEICNIRPSKGEVKLALNPDDEVTFLGMEHLGIKQKFTAPQIIKRLNDVSGSYTYFAENDVLLAKITPCFENGKLGIAKNLINGVGFGSSEFIVFRPKPELSNEWLYYFLLRDDFRIDGARNMSGAVGHKRVNKEFIEKTLIPLPPLSVQQKIVAKLDAIFAEIDKATVAVEANAKNSESLFQSYLTEIFERSGEGWLESNLKDLTSKIGSGSTPRGGNESYKETGISLIRSMNVYDKGFLYKKLAFIDDAQAKELSNVTVEKDDVLLNITGASVARCCIVPDDVLPARVNQHVSILRSIKGLINPKLLYFILVSPFHKSRLLSVGEGGGATRQAITKAQLQDYVIRFPKDAISQSELINKIVGIQNTSLVMKNAYELKLKNLIPLKQSILHQAFNGELVKD